MQSGSTQVGTSSFPGTPRNEVTHYGLFHAKHMNSPSGSSREYTVSKYPYGRFSQVVQQEGFVWLPFVVPCEYTSRLIYIDRILAFMLSSRYVFH